MWDKKMDAMWGKRAIAKVGINWDKGWNTRVAVVFATSSGVFFTFLPLAVSGIGGNMMTPLWIVFSILSFWVMSACGWLLLRYSGKSEGTRLMRIENKLMSMDKKLDKLNLLDELRVTNNLLRNLVERLDKNDKL
jgi:hypothetical protein